MAVFAPRLTAVTAALAVVAVLVLTSLPPPGTTTLAIGPPRSAGPTGRLSAPSSLESNHPTAKAVRSNSAAAEIANGGTSPSATWLGCAGGANDGIQQAYDPAARILYEAWNGCGGVGFAYSNDGGANFSSPAELSACGGWPSIAVAPNGTVFVAYVAACHGGAVADVVASASHGANWSAPVEVNASIDRPGAVRLAVAPNGTVDLLAAGFFDGPGSAVVPYFLQSADGQSTWVDRGPVGPSAGRLPPGSLSFDADALIVAPNGTALALLASQLASGGWTALYFGSLATSSNGSFPVNLVISYPPRPAASEYVSASLGLDASGTLYAAYASNGTILPFLEENYAYIAISTDNGTRWAGPLALTNSTSGSVQAFVTVVGGGPGIAHVAWLANDTPTGAWRLEGTTVWSNGSFALPGAPFGNASGSNGSLAGADLSMTSLGGGEVAVAGALNLSSGGPGQLHAFVTVEHDALPAAPSNLHLRSGHGNITVRWSFPAPSAPWTGFELGWGPKQPSYLLRVGPGQDSATAFPIVPNITYEVAVRAVSDAGDGPASSPPVPVTLSAWSIVRGTVTPADANLTLDQVPVRVTDGTYLATTTVGAHLLNATRAGYQPAIATFQTGWNATTWENLTLAHDTGTVLGFVTPARANLFWDGARVRPNSTGFFEVSGLSGATGTLLANATGFVNATRTLTVPDEAALWVNLTLAPVYGVLELAVDPAGASATLDGRPVTLNRSGMARISLLPGNYTIGAGELGYANRTETARISAGLVDRLWLNLSISPVPVPPPNDDAAIALYGGLLVVAALVLVAGLLYVRRRRPPAPAGPAPEEVYGFDRPDPPPPPESVPEGPAEALDGSDGPAELLGP
jgi:hypothetical protein